MNDLISRQQAIGAIAEYARKLKEEKYRAGSKVTRECYRILTALPEMGWIPCSERLPEKDAIYLVTFASGNVGTSSWHRKTEYNRGFDRYMTGIFGDGSTEIFGVIAWMPLPEPYKGEE